MSTSRDRILDRLRAAQPLAVAVKPSNGHLPMVPLGGQSPAGLRAQFIEQAEKLACIIHQPAAGTDAIQTVLGIIGADRLILSWGLEHIGLPGFAEALATSGIRATQAREASARIGVTGVDACLAATGSLVIATGVGKPRVASLLPPVHIAIVRPGQIIADFETWVALQHRNGPDDFRAQASQVVISGPSRTADIAMQLILGMHGPGELHLVIVGAYRGNI